MKLFISYSSKDRALIAALADDLDLMGHEVWFDRELAHSGGQAWWKVICEQIRACEAVISALSPNLLGSVPCQREYEYARSLGKPILPLVLAEVDYRSLPRDLQEAQLVNFRDRSNEQRRALRDSLRNLPPCPPLPANALDLEPPVPLDPVGALMDRIHKLTADPDAQRLLILDIDDLANDGQAQSLELLRLLVARDDVLTARNLKRVQELLGGAEGAVKPVVPVTEILPAPFVWCDIPEGGVSVGAQQVSVPAFRMAKHPVTFAQFQAFIDAPDGYRNAQWWADLARREHTPGKQQWPIDTHPREGVNWYEAVAFCRWLSDKTGLPISLPTESQWQRAAQGDDGREYPWGGGPDETKCNTRESGLNKTTPVDQHPAGVSPFGVLDLAGNVWEWCLTKLASPYQHPEDNDMMGDAKRVVRGGAFNAYQSSARATYRNGIDPDVRSLTQGFRVVTTA